MARRVAAAVLQQANEGRDGRINGSGLTQVNGLDFSIREQEIGSVAGRAPDSLGSIKGAVADILHQDAIGGELGLNGGDLNGLGFGPEERHCGGRAGFPVDWRRFRGGSVQLGIGRGRVG
jgi:hypothetical protein